MAEEAESEAVVGNGNVVIKPRVFRSQYAHHARQILAQYNAMDHFGGYSFFGPHYVVWERGEFYMRPFGAWADHRYSFHCRPEFLPGIEEPLWAFVVM